MARGGLLMNAPVKRIGYALLTAASISLIVFSFRALIIQRDFMII
jgi:hypothetical protein